MPHKSHTEQRSVTLSKMSDANCIQGLAQRNPFWPQKEAKEANEGIEIYVTPFKGISVQQR